MTAKQINFKNIRQTLSSTELMAEPIASRCIDKYKAKYEATHKVIQFAFILGLFLCLLVPRAYAEHGIVHTPDGPVIELSAATMEAIDSGVSLTFDSEYAVLNKWLFIKWPKIYKRHTFIISKHALSDRYLVHRDDRAIPAIFRSSSQGVAYITKSAQNLFQNYAQERPELQLRISLSKFMLPAPIRLTAFTSNEWKFDSGWGTWQFAN